MYSEHQCCFPRYWDAAVKHQKKTTVVAVFYTEKQNDVSDCQSLLSGRESRIADAGLG